MSGSGRIGGQLEVQAQRPAGAAQVHADQALVLGFSRTPHEDWSRWITRLAVGIPDGHNPIRLVPAPDGGLVWTTPPTT